MIDETILYLPSTVGVSWDPDICVGEPLKRVFSKVLRYDFGKAYTTSGVSKTNNEIIDLVRAERPKYVLWPSSMYEIRESTFQAIRKEGALVIGWFFDDECRFDDYSKWWIPYLDYVLTNDKESIGRYEKLGAIAMHILVTSNPEVFKRLEVQKTYDVSFVGSKIADRGSLVDQLIASGIQVQTFGKGWSGGYVSLDEMVNVYNASGINLVFTKSYGVNACPQLKDKIFNVCMCGGFLLCEYVPGIEGFYEVDKEIVCFGNIDEATAKIAYYLDHEVERQAIAQAGWERAQRDHGQATWLLRIFEEIEESTRSGNQRAIDHRRQLDMPRHIRRQPSAYHLRWAKALARKGCHQDRWQEELDLALFYDPKSVEAHWLRLIGRLPVLMRPSLIRLGSGLRTLKRSLYSCLAAIPVLGKIKHALNKCRSMYATILKRMHWLPWEISLRLQGYSACFQIFTDMTLPEKLLLYRLAHSLRRGSVIVEVGSYLGGSSTFLAVAAKKRGCVVYCVDTWLNEGMSEGQRDTYAAFLSNTQRFADEIRPLRGRSVEMAEKFSEPIELLLVDGDHSYSGCRSDLEAWLPKLESGGIVVFHDFGWAAGVQRTVQEMVKPIEESPGHVMENIYWAQVNPRGEPQ